MGKQHLTFISYSRTNKDFALELAKELKAAGFLIWFDQLDIPTGSRWDDEIQKALEQCEIFMVILTPNSIASNNVKDEIGYAIDSNKRILPVLLENANIPFRLRRFQYVDFTNKSYNEGINLAKQLLRNLLNEPTEPKLATSPEAQNQNTKSEAERAAELKADANRLARQRAEAIRMAREREQLDRQPKFIPPTRATDEQTSEQRVQRQSTPMLIPIIIGITLILLLCLGGGWMAWPYIFPPTTKPSETPITETPITETPTFTLTPSHTPAITVPTLITITPTFTPSPTNTPTITPFSSQTPDQFIIFYFETIIYNKDYELGWSLLTQTFKEKNNPTGIEDYKATWEKVVGWDRPSMTVDYLTSSTAIVSIPSITFYAETKYSLLDRKYCLVRDENRRTWMIESKTICGL
jgi:hypothetical protein